jgi:pSer/pThr/pTyr-binding forkhead associated (FHA) protein
MATIQIIEEDDPIALTLSQVGIGRAQDNEIVIDDETVSSYHALITIRPSGGDENVDEYILEDLDSTNQTFVNNKPISSHRLKEGDIIRVGQTRLKFSKKQSAGTQKTFSKTRKINPRDFSKY